MIIRPDMRELELCDILLEFKFVSLKQAKLTGKQAKELSPGKLKTIEMMKEKMEDAENMLIDYGDSLESKYGNLRLRRFAVVSLGFERLWAKEII